MFTMDALSRDKIGLFDMPYPRAGYVQIDKAGIMIVNRFHLGICFCAQRLLPPWMSLPYKSGNSDLLRMLAVS